MRIRLEWLQLISIRLYVAEARAGVESARNAGNEELAGRWEARLQECIDTEAEVTQILHDAGIPLPGEVDDDDYDEAY